MFHTGKENKKQLTRSETRVLSLKRKVAAATAVVALIVPFAAPAVVTATATVTVPPSTVKRVRATPPPEDSHFNGPTFNSHMVHTYFPNSDEWGRQSVTSIMIDYNYGHVSWSYIEGANAGMGRVYSGVASPGSSAVAFVAGYHDQFNGTYWDAGNSANGWPEANSSRIWWGW